MTEAKTKSVLITGCSSGIGECVAHGLHARGYRVFASVRKPQDCAPFQQAGIDCLLLDYADSASIESAVTQLLERTGGHLYALFNNGAYGQPGAVEDLTTDTLRAQFETNLFGWHELTRQIIPLMRQQGEGRIIQNSSILGFVTMAYRGAYNASKFALEGLSDTLRLELRGSNVFVSLVEPGPIISRFRQNAYRKWRQNVDMEGSIHSDVYAAMESRFTSEGPVAPFTLPPEAVLKRVIHALESPRPKARYYVTFPTYLFAFLKRVLPVGILDRALWKVSGA